MPICPKCKTEVPKGFAFCMECGTKLPKNKYCPECGAELPETARFCFSCGAKLEAEKSNMSVKDNVFGGNVTGSFNTTNNINNTNISNTINNTYVTHNESTDVVECAVCKKLLSKGMGVAYKCKICGGFFCSEHIDTAHNACFSCLQKEALEREERAQKYYEAGLAEYDAGNYTAALELYGKGAELGSALAYHAIGNCYYDGVGVKRNLEKSAEYYGYAAELGLAKSQFNLGNAYYKGEGLTERKFMAFFWYKKAAEQGYDRAQYMLGRCYLAGIGAWDPEEAVRWFKKSAAQNHDKACYYLGYCYEEGKGVDRDKQIAREWYEKAAELGNASAKEALKRVKPSRTLFRIEF